jgi:ammonium transporter, Amt family
LLALLILAPSLAFAAAGTDAGNTAWMLASTALVLMMTLPGVALFYGGMVRKKNLISTTAQVFAIACLVSVLWAALAYSLVFYPANPFIGGFGNFFLHRVSLHSRIDGIPESVFMMFQMTFAIITPALIVGAFVERMKFSALLWFVSAWLLLVYAPIAHMVWGGGWLGSLGLLDFAGGTVVHINAGVAGLVAALVMGPRLGHRREAMNPANLIYTMTGAGLLWVGWFGFNAGSALAANEVAGMAMAVTQIAAAVAALAWMSVEWWLRGKPTLLGMTSGAVAGLVAITPAAGFVGPPGAFAIGAIAGPVCFCSVVYLKRWLGYDDALDAFGVHGIGGIAGALLTGVFAAPIFGGAGLSTEARGSIIAQFGVQALGVVITMAYTACVTLIILKLIERTLGLRVREQEEREGLDTTQHGEQIYE